MPLSRSAGAILFWGVIALAAMVATLTVSWLLWGDRQVIYLEPEETPEPYYADKVDVQNQRGPDLVPMVEQGGSLFVRNSRCNTYPHPVRVTTQVDTILVNPGQSENAAIPEAFVMFPPLTLDPGGSACPEPDREKVPSTWQINPDLKPGLYFSRIHLTIWGEEGAVLHTTTIVTDMFRVIDPDDCPVNTIESVVDPEGDCTAPTSGAIQ